MIRQKTGTQKLVQFGYPFPTDELGIPICRNLQGPEYMRLMRRTIQKAGIKIFDRSPALELLADFSGVGGAIGVNLDTGEDWIVKAKSVVIATGGCAFLKQRTWMQCTDGRWLFDGCRSWSGSIRNGIFQCLWIFNRFFFMYQKSSVSLGDFLQ
ncbi:FAD-binding protein [Paenibacillus naphthalenovorans]|uniref:FAD-binding protein n=1 Tax=Paenibacillus naphthalenovorans TaxID=162209 RepID=UPI003D28F3E1